MRLLCVAFCILALAGCGGGIEGQIVGRWHIDPRSIEVSRLTPVGGQTQDWTDAAAILAKVEVQFSKDGSVTARGFDLTTPGKWAVKGNSISVKSSDDSWPKMTFDPKIEHIHLSVVKGDDSLRMDLVKD